MKEENDPNYEDWDQTKINFAYMVLTLIAIALIAKLLHYCSSQYSGL